MKEPVDHILRPRLPWRSPNDPAITECGYNAASVKTISRDDYFKRLKEFGQQRTAMTMCMTCADTARRWPTWDEDARKALEREIEWECKGMGYYIGKELAERYGREPGFPRESGRGALLLDELQAITKLIATHRDEFTKLVQEIGAAREWNAKKLDLASKKDRLKH